MRSEVLICFTKMLTAEESRMGREWRWMRGFKHEMFSTVDVRALLLRIIAPEHKNEMFAFFRESADDCIGKLFPSFPLMRTGVMCAYGERRI